MYYVIGNTIWTSDMEFENFEKYENSDKLIEIFKSKRFSVEFNTKSELRFVCFSNKNKTYDINGNIVPRGIHLF